MIQVPSTFMADTTITSSMYAGLATLVIACGWMAPLAGPLAANMLLPKMLKQSCAMVGPAQQIKLLAMLILLAVYGVAKWISTSKFVRKGPVSLAKGQADRNMF